MSLKTKIGELLGFKTTPQIISSPDDLAKFFGAEYVTGMGQPVTPLRAMQLTTVFTCVRVLSESMGMLPCRLYKRVGRNKEIADNHRLHDLLYVAPNDYMTAQEFWELLMVCLCLRGNFYAYKVYALGNVVELLPLDPSSVTPKLNDDWTVEYQVNFKNGGLKTLSQDEIWHVRLFTLDGLNGLNPIAYARKCIGLGLDTEEHGTKLFKNGAVTSGVLETAESLTDVAFNRLKNEFTENYAGLANTYKPMILEEGLTWKPTALNLEDSQFLETRQYQATEICGLFRVPPHLAANMEKMTLNNIEHMGMSFVNYSLVPYMTRIESRIKVGLLSEKDRKTHYAKFNAGALLRGDLKTRYESYGKGIQWGWLSPNDCRELEDMNPREGGDIYLTPMNMTTDPEGENDANKAAS
ncbi:phage portal protein [Acinetobacter tandoii]|uniref:HK97 family phage portal protein n=1 Tax=Acinetobacter tandoii DSM 14970 = CIP 107469 TaxID=1120927 RepID=R9B2T4_9GAMM|nr:phage portal protein [Acinetobacter tandoii]EOR06706.1 HK97 family phage portal protein [Acinetobacter tandoii DSM 14970 = CIP 107469]